MDSKLPPLDVTQEETEDAIHALQDDLRASELAELYCRKRQLEDALMRLEKAEELLRWSWGHAHPIVCKCAKCVEIRAFLEAR